MKTDRADEMMSRLLSTAAPEMSAEWEGRAIDRLTATRPARGISRRLVIAAIGVAALVGLGFVPIPMGKAPGALERALAQAEQATTVHITQTSWTQKGERVVDEWHSDTGFFRREQQEEDGQLQLTMASVPWELVWSSETKHAYESYELCYLQPADSTEMPNRSQFERTLDVVEWTSDWLGQTPDILVREYQEATLWGGSVNVVEVKVNTQGDHFFVFGGPYDKDIEVRTVAEIDPSNNRLLSVREYKLTGRKWEQTYEASYEWDVEIPDDLKQFDLPPGTKLTRNIWWEHRADQVIAQLDTRDWGTVTLHAIDMKRNGDVVLSLSGVAIHSSAPPLGVKATGSGGEHYTQDSHFGCSYHYSRHSVYWVTTLIPADRDRHPRSFTLTVTPDPEAPSADQSVTFRNIPLPPRQNTDDLFAAETEVIQY